MPAINWIMARAVALPSVGALVALVPSARNIPSRYQSMEKPKWTPPSWVFAAVSTGMYTMIGFASFMVYRSGGGFRGIAKVPLMLFGSQLALNWTWAPLFFSSQNFLYPLMEMGVVIASAAGCAKSFLKVNRRASILMLIYIRWLIFLAVFNYFIWRANSKDEKTPVM